MNATADIPNVSLAASALEELMPQLLKLSANTRLEIIARLSHSLQSAPAATVEAETPTKASLPSFVGAWANDAEADKMEQAILAIRYPANEPELS